MLAWAWGVLLCVPCCSGGLGLTLAILRHLQRGFDSSSFAGQTTTYQIYLQLVEPCNREVFAGE